MSSKDMNREPAQNEKPEEEEDQTHNNEAEDLHSQPEPSSDEPVQDSPDEPHGSRGSPHASPETRADDAIRTPEDDDEDNAFFSETVCPCEDEEPEPMSEYDVPGEWVTYTGPVNETVYQFANRQAEMESEFLVRDMADVTPQQQVLDSSSSSSDAVPIALMNEEGASTAEVAAINAFGPSDIVTSIQTALATARIHDAAVLREISMASDADFCADYLPAEIFLNSAHIPGARAEEPDDDDLDENVIIDEWEVFMAAYHARDAAARSEKAANDARQARRRADAAELAGSRHAGRLARQAVRFDFFAAQAAKLAVEAEKKAVRIARKFASLNEATLEQARAAEQARATEHARAAEQATAQTNEQAREGDEARADEEARSSEEVS